MVTESGLNIRRQKVSHYHKSGSIVTTYIIHTAAVNIESHVTAISSEAQLCGTDHLFGRLNEAPTGWLGLNDSAGTVGK